VDGFKGSPTTLSKVQALVEKYGVKYRVVEDSEAVYFSNSTSLSDDLVGQLYNEYWDGNDGFMRYEEEKQSSTNTDQSLATTAADYVSEKNMNALQAREFDWLADTSLLKNMQPTYQNCPLGGGIVTLN
jgi:hypothetical protein